VGAYGRGDWNGTDKIGQRVLDFNLKKETLGKVAIFCDGKAKYPVWGCRSQITTGSICNIKTNILNIYMSFPMTRLGHQAKIDSK
jgi:hypothetical protein